MEQKQEQTPDKLRSEIVKNSYSKYCGTPMISKTWFGKEQNTCPEGCVLKANSSSGQKTTCVIDENHRCNKITWSQDKDKEFRQQCSKPNNCLIVSDENGKMACSFNYTPKRDTTPTASVGGSAKVLYKKTNERVKIRNMTRIVYIGKKKVKYVKWKGAYVKLNTLLKQLH